MLNLARNFQTATAVKKIVALVAGHDDSVPIAANLLEMLKALKNLDVAEINKVDDEVRRARQRGNE